MCVCVCVCVCFLIWHLCNNNTEIDSLLQTLRSLSAHDEEVEELNVLEGMLKSDTFKKAKQVIGIVIVL